MSDPINNPGHYTFGTIEVITVIEDWNLNYNRGNVVKYVARAGRKRRNTELQDLKKAAFYLDREIKRINEEKK